MWLLPLDERLLLLRQQVGVGWRAELCEFETESGCFAFAHLPPLDVPLPPSEDAASAAPAASAASAASASAELIGAGFVMHAEAEVRVPALAFRTPLPHTADSTTARFRYTLVSLHLSERRVERCREFTVAGEMRCAALLDGPTLCLLRNTPGGAELLCAAPYGEEPPVAINLGTYASVECLGSVALGLVGWSDEGEPRFGSELMLVLTEPIDADAAAAENGADAENADDAANAAGGGGAEAAAAEAAGAEAAAAEAAAAEAAALGLTPDLRPSHCPCRVVVISGAASAEAWCHPLPALAILGPTLRCASLRVHRCESFDEEGGEGAESRPHGWEGCGCTLRVWFGTAHAKAVCVDMRASVGCVTCGHGVDASLPSAASPPLSGDAAAAFRISSTLNLGGAPSQLLTVRLRHATEHLVALCSRQVEVGGPPPTPPRPQAAEPPPEAIETLSGGGAQGCLRCAVDDGGPATLPATLLFMQLLSPSGEVLRDEQSIGSVVAADVVGLGHPQLLLARADGRQSAHTAADADAADADAGDAAGVASSVLRSVQVVGIEQTWNTPLPAASDGGGALARWRQLAGVVRALERRAARGELAVEAQARGSLTYPCVFSVHMSPFPFFLYVPADAFFSFSSLF